MDSSIKIFKKSYLLHLYLIKYSDPVVACPSKMVWKATTMLYMWKTTSLNEAVTWAFELWSLHYSFKYSVSSARLRQKHLRIVSAFHGPTVSATFWFWGNVIYVYTIVMKNHCYTVVILNGSTKDCYTGYGLTNTHILSIWQRDQCGLESPDTL